MSLVSRIEKIEEILNNTEDVEEGFAKKIKQRLTRLEREVFGNGLIDEEAEEEAEAEDEDKFDPPPPIQHKGYIICKPCKPSVKGLPSYWNDEHEEWYSQKRMATTYGTKKEAERIILQMRENNLQAIAYIPTKEGV